LKFDANCNACKQINLLKVSRTPLISRVKRHVDVISSSEHYRPFMTHFATQFQWNSGRWLQNEKVYKEIRQLRHL